MSLNVDYTFFFTWASLRPGDRNATHTERIYFDTWSIINDHMTLLWIEPVSVRAFVRMYSAHQKTNCVFAFDGPQKSTFHSEFELRFPGTNNRSFDRSVATISIYAFYYMYKITVIEISIERVLFRIKLQCWFAKKFCYGRMKIRMPFSAESRLAQERKKSIQLYIIIRVRHLRASRSHWSFYLYVTLFHFVYTLYDKQITGFWTISACFAAVRSLLCFPAHSAHNIAIDGVCIGPNYNWMSNSVTCADLCFYLEIEVNGSGV